MKNRISNTTLSHEISWWLRSICENISRINVRHYSPSFGTIREHIYVNLLTHHQAEVYGMKIIWIASTARRIVWNAAHVQVHRTVANPWIADNGSVSIIAQLLFLSNPFSRRLNSFSWIIYLEIERKLRRSRQLITNSIERFSCATLVRNHRVENYGKDLVLVKW